jgi:hypothetical protein
LTQTQMPFQPDFQKQSGATPGTTQPLLAAR